MNVLEKRKEAIAEKFKKLTKKPAYIIYAILGVIISWGVYIRTRNGGITEWQFPVEPDSFAFLRYAKYIVEHGHLMEIDMLRYYPIGWTNLSEFRVLSYFIAYLYKFLHIFIPSITVANADVIYPVICFAIGLIFFFLFVKKAFNWKVALVSSALLAVTPAYLYRTMAGFADKEAFAMMVLFASLYFFISAWKSDDTKKAVCLSILSAIFTALTGLVWGGFIFILLAMNTFILINLLLGNLNKKQMIVYTLWFITAAAILSIVYPERFNLSVRDGPQMIFTFFVFFATMVVYFTKNTRIAQKLHSPFKKRIPIEVVLILFSLLAIIALALTNKPGQYDHPGNLIYQIKAVYPTLTNLFATSRWSATIQEGQLPYFTDWINSFGYKYLLLGFGGIILAFYAMLKIFRHKLLPTAIFSIAILGISLSSYSESSILNGKSLLSDLIFSGCLITVGLLFFYVYFRFYKHDKQSFESLKRIDQGIFFTLVFSFFLLLSARTAVRLIFPFAPVVTIFAGYCIIQGIKKIKLIKTDSYRLISLIALLLFVSIALTQASEESLAEARHTSSTYTYQWQDAMNWVKENTPEDAVFAHWWDYGYFVQTGGERATLSDGGNSRGAINHFIGRHVLTAQNETEALELLKANNATNLLIPYDDIGIYSAFSFIGADRDYDRYSWIDAFLLDQNDPKTPETTLIYRGGSALDEDFIYQDQIYPQMDVKEKRATAGIVAVVLTIGPDIVEINGTKRMRNIIKQPHVVINHKTQKQLVQIPLECVFINNQEIIFPEKGYPGCFRIIPTIGDDNQINEIGAGLLLHPKVRRTLFTKLFLYDQPSEHFKKVYTDEDKGMPLAVYQGRLIGPLKIWEISYPSNLTIPPEYYGTEVPDPEVEAL